MKKYIILGLLILVCTIAVYSQETGTFKDHRDGKVYKTVKIGTQIWLAENLAYKTKSGCWSYEDDQSNVTEYGYLYDWETAKNVCPKGWHLPTNLEWKTLIAYLGGKTKAGDKVKETSTTHWACKNGRATNQSGFTALPGGKRNSNGTFSGIRKNCNFWTNTENNLNKAFYYNLCCNVWELRQYKSDKTEGFCLRCVKDI